MEVSGEVMGRIGRGLLVLVGMEMTDTESDAAYLAHKIKGLRIFQDDEGRMNLSVEETGGALLVVSQFTLYGNCKKGMRPSFDRAARPEHARTLYEYFLNQLRKPKKMHVESGVFQASMLVYLVNDGPVTLICDSQRAEVRI